METLESEEAGSVDLRSPLVSMRCSLGASDPCYGLFSPIAKSWTSSCKNSLLGLPMTTLTGITGKDGAGERCLLGRKTQRKQPPSQFGWNAGNFRLRSEVSLPDLLRNQIESKVSSTPKVEIVPLDIPL